MQEERRGLSFVIQSSLGQQLHLFPELCLVLLFVLTHTLAVSNASRRLKHLRLQDGPTVCPGLKQALS